MQALGVKLAEFFHRLKKLLKIFFAQTGMIFLDVRKIAIQAYIKSKNIWKLKT